MRVRRETIPSSRCSYRFRVIFISVLKNNMRLTEYLFNSHIAILHDYYYYYCIILCRRRFTDKMNKKQKTTNRNINIFERLQASAEYTY